MFRRKAANLVNASRLLGAILVPGAIPYLVSLPADGAPASPSQRPVARVRGSAALRASPAHPLWQHAQLVAVPVPVCNIKESSQDMKGL